MAASVTRESPIAGDSVRRFAKLALVRAWYSSSEIRITFISSPKTWNFVYMCKIQSKGGVMRKKQQTNADEIFLCPLRQGKHCVAVDRLVSLFIICYLTYLQR